MFADSVFRQVTEYPFRSFIPTHDHTIEILTDDCVIRGIYNGSQQSGGLLCIPLFSDVMKEIHGTDDRPIFVSNRVIQRKIWRGHPSAALLADGRALCVKIGGRLST